MARFALRISSIVRLGTVEESKSDFESKILWRLFGKKAKNLKDTILHLISSRNILPEQCWCRNQGCLGCSGYKSSFLLRPDDPNHYRKLLQRCFVVDHGKPLSFHDFSPISGWSQREDY